MQSNVKILVAPLNWGIGHATRCVPIINELISQGFTPVLASDGNALHYLQKEFPNLKTYDLPSYQITYTKHRFFFKLSLFIQIPKVLKGIKREQQTIQKVIALENIQGIISDNRFGAYSNHIPSVIITHQIQILSGLTTFITSAINRKLLYKFKEVWIPDTSKNPNLTGKLSNTKQLKTTVKYIGLLSRFQAKIKTKKKYKYAILVLLSGIESQRSSLEIKLIKELKNTSKKVLFIRGLVDSMETLENTKNITFRNFLLHNELEKALNESEVVIARSGYSTIMDLAQLQKKAFFIPTPGQTEQEYLAKYLKKWNIAPFVKQQAFKLNDLNKIKNYTGFTENYTLKNTSLFQLFIPKK